MSQQKHQQQARTFHYKYVDYIKTLALLVANSSGIADLSEQNVIAGAEQIATFEAELFGILEAPGKSDIYRPVVLRKFQNVTDQFAKNKSHGIDWVSIINKMHPEKTLVSADDVVDVSTVGYFTKLMQLLHKTPLQTIVNYLHWRFVSQFLPYTSSNLRNFYFGMQNFMEDPIKNTPRWRLCGFEPSFDPVISFVFANAFITEEVENCANEVLKNVKQATVRTIRSSVLLSDVEKLRAENKVSAMNFVLGIPESLKNFSVISDYYKELSISEDYFENLLILRHFYKMKEFEVIKTPHYVPTSNKNFFKITTISSIGSAYEFFENRVLIKVENLVAPLFDPAYPEYKKYGILGFVIAYEIMHAFNDADSIGIERPRRHLYSEQTRLKYWSKHECFMNQYDKYYISHPLNSERNLYVDGERSALENIADSSAIQIAMQAYHDSHNKKQVDPSEENDKSFFSSFASLLCRPELEAFYLSRFNFALRTLPRFRVVGSLANIDEFARTFSCLKNTQMNPAIKCNFWN
ncbi:endothelin-converting enzyme homolog [Copidosoma floridanum]|uniref:endothelin-converting enzyme homolog n=1 Tax=Copidosoma floridanum TaxID=29053 RepID=UPI000C6F97FA|nr:endothelin-converting enzyme homolog [Copidosoma floridanum]